ncbi:hypothetical protein AKJ57_06085 [candidate division MSBL1 archaeon SCGC-AAA259A05]|uniref:Uncharacterized protein n=1 Tax=candidate division MSBL1 archaeon SCGC-AAA259A05 TaxID=1698259 RepID=A0A133U420_9EURY|nr:hypothetical protein AKJ57_06085 [candidate division MSBL1 archaeon SCGC-AAA259A05]
MKEGKKRISVIVQEGDHERWKEYAERTDRSVSGLVRRSVNRSIGSEGLGPKIDRIESKLDLVLAHLGVDLEEAEI